MSERYRCIECGYRFTYRPGFLGRHYENAVVYRAIDDVMDGKSLGAAARATPKNSQSDKVPARSTVLRWMQRAKSTTAKIPGNIPISVGGLWRVDELYFSTDRGGRYMAGVMDSESRFMLTNETYPEDEKLQTYDATEMLRRAIRIAKSVPDVLVSDRLSGFERGFRNAILRSRKHRRKGQKPVHIRTASVQKRHINNSIFECQNGTVRDRKDNARIQL